MKKYALLLTVLFSLIWIIPSYAIVEVPVFEGTFERSTGAPQPDIREFNVLLELSGECVFKLYNGAEDDTANKVSSSVIMINGMDALGPSGFNQNVSYLETTCNLVPGLNYLNVELRGKPGGKIKVKIVKMVAAEGAGEVGTLGGTVEVKDPANELFGLRVEIPPNALAEKQLIEIKKSPHISEGYTVRFEPHGVKFNKNVIIELPYHFELAENEVIVAKFYDEEKNFREFANIIEHDILNKKIKVIVSGFSDAGVSTGTLTTDPIMTEFDIELDRFPVRNMSPLFGSGRCRGISQYTLWWFVEIRNSIHLNEAYNKNIAIEIGSRAHDETLLSIFTIIENALEWIYLRHFDVAVKLQEGLKEGNPQLLFMGEPSDIYPTHAVLVTGWEDPYFRIYDPDYFEEKLLYYDGANFGLYDGNYTKFAAIGYWSLPHHTYELIYGLNYCAFDPVNQSPETPLLLSPEPSELQQLEGIPFTWTEVEDPEDGSDVKYCIVINDTELPPNEIYNNCKNSGPDDPFPKVSDFQITSATLTEGESLTANYTVTDNKSLERVELWRAPDDGGTPGSWEPVTGASEDISGNIATGNLNDTPSVGTYWYGLHVIDTDKNCTTERNQDCITGAPKKYGNNDNYFSDNIFYLPISLEPVKEYAWSVWAVDQCGKFSLGGSWWTFTTINSDPDLGPIMVTVNTQPQPDYGVNVQHFYPDNYFIAVGFGGNIKSADVIDGPNIVGTFPGHAILGERPQIGYIYTIKLTYNDGSWEDVYHEVNGVNDNFSWIIYPADSTTIEETTPTFSWQSAPGVVENYSIGIHNITDGKDEPVWGSSIPSGQTSCIFNFDGQAIADLQQGNTYNIYLHSYNENGNQATTVSTFTIQPELPSPPTGLSATYDSTNNWIWLTWQDNGADFYHVYWGTEPDVTTGSEYGGQTPDPEFSHTGVVPGSTYYYRVTAVNSAGESELSEEESAYVNPDDFPADFTVNFPDQNLEARIRDLISKPVGDIVYSDLQVLYGFYAQDRGISELEGLQYCSNINFISLSKNQISDISPLGNLRGLIELRLEHNQIKDIRYLSGLSNLSILWLSDNQIDDFKPLTGLTNLSFLDLRENSVSDSDLDFLPALVNLNELWLGLNNISDIEPLSGLINLTYLSLSFNNITDIMPLAGLVNLSTIGLSWNQITDISALVDNLGIGSGDGVGLIANPLDSTSCSLHIPILISRGVNVYHDCP